MINLYINTMKTVQRLLYYKEPIVNESRITFDNIVNLRKIRPKKNMINSKVENKKIFRERIEKLGLNIDDLVEFESHFESGNLQLAFIGEPLDLIKNNDTDKKNETNCIFNSPVNLINNSININTINSSINDTYNNNNTSNEVKNEKKIEKYELFLHNDTNTSGYTQWFFFRVSNTKKDKTINLNIMNFLRKRTKYSNGIKIWCYSRKNAEINKIGWHHTTEDVDYYQNFLYKFKFGRKEFYYTLSFNYTFQFDNDEVFFANCIPYTYTDLIRDLNNYSKNEDDKYRFFNRRKLCSTIIGNNVEYFSINNDLSIYPNNTNINKSKNGVVLFGRQHPSETVGSWALKGAIDFLMGDSDEAKYLRDNFIFKIIPMINVDGVICGNTRTSLSGCDLNRRWTNPNILLHPEIYYAKEMIMDFYKKFTIECIVDFHGHFGAFNSFFYANHKDNNFSSCKFFPFTCAKKSKVIQFEKCSFKMPNYKEGTGRINLYRELNIENVVTLEISNFGCNSGRYENQYFTVDTLKEIGRDICKGILLFHYHSNLKVGINNDLNNYPFLEKELENDEKIINDQFIEYLNSTKNEDNNTTKVNDDDLDDDLNDDASDSISDPSGDNLDEKEIIKLLPPLKKLKKVMKKNSKKKYNNKRHIISLNHNNSNIISNNINYMIYNQNDLSEKNYNKTKIQMLKIKDYKSKDIKNFNTQSKSRRENSSVDDNRINQNNKYMNNRNQNTTKNGIFEMSPTAPNMKNNNSQKAINIKINFSINRILDLSDKYTQTEEIFFKENWRFFIGQYKIIAPQYDKYPIISQIKPIKLNSIKNSFSFVNKDIIFNSSNLVQPQTIDFNRRKRNIANLMKMNKLTFESINEIINKGNRNGLLGHYASIKNNLNNKKSNNINKKRNSIIDNIINIVHYNNQRSTNNYPIIKPKNIILKKILSERKEKDKDKVKVNTLIQTIMLSLHQNNKGKSTKSN